MQERAKSVHIFIGLSQSVMSKLYPYVDIGNIDMISIFYWNMHDIPRHTQISISIMSTQYRINIVSCLKHLWQTHTYQISLSMLRDELGKIYPCVKGLQSKHIKRKKLWLGTFNIDIWTKQKKIWFWINIVDLDTCLKWIQSYESKQHIAMEI